MDVRELETRREWLDAFPVMAQLRTHLDEATYLDYFEGMTTDGYRLIAGSVDGEIVALAGIAAEVNMYYGRHLWVFELVTAADHRSEGHGRELLAYVGDWASERGCELLALSSGVQRTAAHRFYEERADMGRASYVYTRPLK